MGLATVVDHTQQILVELEALDLGSDVDIICHQLVGELELVPQLLDLVRDLGQLFLRTAGIEGLKDRIAFRQVVHEAIEAKQLDLGLVGYGRQFFQKRRHQESLSFVVSTVGLLVLLKEQI